VLKGNSLSKGVAIGKIYLLDSSKFCIIKQKLDAEKVGDEIKRFRQAIEKSKKQMQEIKKHASKVGDKYAVILDTYTLLLEDEVIVNDTIENIKNNKLNAEWALTETLDKFTKLFNNMNDDYLKAKKDDLDLVVHGIIRNLIGHSQEKLSEIDEPVILVAHTLSPSDTIAMPKNLVLGMVTEVGGKTSHVAIFASALGIPLIGGIKDLTAQVNTGEYIIIDAIDGYVVTNPSEEQLKHYRKKQENYRSYEQKLLENIHQPAKTLDGTHVKLMANIESPDELKSLRKFGAEGVGLYRTEYLYLMAKTPPTENELYENFKKVAQEMEPLPVVIRTLDIGMDKQLQDLNEEPENNPALGLRGIRMSLSNPGLFTHQLKAILRASMYGDIRILYPMISAVEEFIEANELLEHAKDHLKKQQIPFKEDISVGAMVETPAAAICVDHLLEAADFVSVGTNDLIQYLLAVDRTNESVASLYQPFHPAVLKSLKGIFKAGRDSGKEVSICGEMGGDPLATIVLLGLGFQGELSMEAHSIPKVKKVIRKISLEEAKQMADHALSLSSTEEINNFILSEMQARFPSDFDRDTTFGEKLFPVENNSN